MSRKSPLECPCEHKFGKFCGGMPLFALLIRKPQNHIGFEVICTTLLRKRSRPCNNIAKTVITLFQKRKRFLYLSSIKLANSPLCIRWGYNLSSPPPWLQPAYNAVMRRNAP